jgi:hypothetical protein
MVALSVISIYEGKLLVFLLFKYTFDINLIFNDGRVHSIFCQKFSHIVELYIELLAREDTAFLAALDSANGNLQGTCTHMEHSYCIEPASWSCFLRRTAHCEWGLCLHDSLVNEGLTLV